VAQSVVSFFILWIKPDKIGTMTVKAIIFDFGGVLYFQPNLTWMRRWQVLLGLKDDPIISAFLAAPEDSEIVMALMVGEMPESEVWEMMAKRWKIKPALVRRLQRSLMSHKRWNTELANFLESLRPRFKTAVLSNASIESRQTFTEIYGIDRLVDEIIISAEERIAKPAERIYQIALERLGVLPEEAVFLDDMPRNVEAARQLGLNAILFQDNAQAMAEIEELLAA
jgi:epoxide hydrolase-like predicted phosphatase